jgi:integrase
LQHFLEPLAHVAGSVRCGHPDLLRLACSELRDVWQLAQCLGMMTFTDLPSVPSGHLAPFTDQLRLAVAAYLARFQGSSREHTASDLRCLLTWCEERGLDPLAARRPHLELYIRWMQKVRRFKPSTVSRRFSVAAGFYRTCVIDGLLGHSPAGHVRRPSVPPESPTLGFTHLQFEALLTAARESSSPYDLSEALIPRHAQSRHSAEAGGVQAALREVHAGRLAAMPGTNSRPKPCYRRNRAGHAGLPASLQCATGRRPASLRARQTVSKPNEPDGGG